MTRNRIRSSIQKVFGARWTRFFSIGLLAVAVGSGCSTRSNFKQSRSSASVAVDDAHTGKKRVRVSLANRAVYVYDEKNRLVFAEAVAIGKPNTPTPRGEFKAFNKQSGKRSGSYGFHVSDKSITPGKRSELPGNCRYVGYPMPYWVEFKSGYGFHAGSVWPTPRSHGCLRLHKTVAKRFFDLVDEGTPVFIAQTLPEDSAKVGKQIWRPTDYAAPNSPNAVLISNLPFSPNSNVHF